MDVAQHGKNESAKFVVNAKKKTTAKAAVKVVVDADKLKVQKEKKEMKKGKSPPRRRLPSEIRRRKNSYLQSAPASVHASPDPPDPEDRKGNGNFF